MMNCPVKKQEQYEIAVEHSHGIPCIPVFAMQTDRRKTFNGGLLLEGTRRHTSVTDLLEQPGELVDRRDGNPFRSQQILEFPRRHRVRPLDTLLLLDDRGHLKVAAKDDILQITPIFDGFEGLRRLQWRSDPPGVGDEASGKKARRPKYQCQATGRQ